MKIILVFSVILLIAFLGVFSYDIYHYFAHERKGLKWNWEQKKWVKRVKK